MSSTTIMDHPLIQHKIGIMRMKSTSTKEFRDLVSEVAMLIYYEASRNLPLTDKEIETPLIKATVKEIAGKKLCVVPILRAGLHMADGILNITPNAKVGHIGLYRGIKNIRFLCLIAAPEGTKKLQEAHPDVDIYIGAMDERLNEQGYILPGLGDAGDRIYGTK